MEPTPKPEMDLSNPRALKALAALVEGDDFPPEYSSTRTFLTSQDYALTVHLQHLEMPTPMVHVRITSRWGQARDPQAERSVLDLSLTQDELAALVAELSKGLDRAYRTPTRA